MDLNRWARLHWDRIVAWGLVIGGAVAVYAGWSGVAGTAFPAEQMPYLVSGGIAGGLLIVLGGALLVSADMRDEWHKLDRIEAVLLDQREEREEREDEPTAAIATATTAATTNGRSSVRSGRSRV
jgi:hypothetical protein